MTDTVDSSSVVFLATQFRTTCAAPFGARLMAFLIDLAILGCLHIFLLLLVGNQIILSLSFDLSALVYSGGAFLLFFS